MKCLRLIIAVRKQAAPVHAQILVQVFCVLSVALGMSPAFQPSEVAAAPDPSTSRPNIVIIMVDDMGYGDAGCYGGTAFPTPNIDRLAKEGMRFTDFHSNGCVCSPTRAALMTGRYQQRSGVDGVIYAAFNRNRHHGLQLKEVTLAELLRDAGYSTGAFGKWHLGYQTQYNPIHQGFDRFVGYVSGNVDFHAHIDGAGQFDWWHQDQQNREPGYTTHLITRHACEFIRSAVSVGDPFCVYIAHEAPHDPYQGPHDEPVRREGSSKLLYNHRESEHAARAYAEMMREMDLGVGEVLATLKKADVDNNTFVMFFSDNGATGPGSCGSLYGMKGTLWEGGHRVPGIARWPGKIARGSQTSQLATTMDVLPTVLDIAGLTPPHDLSLDGQSLSDVLRGVETSMPRKLFWQYRDAVSMRDGDWKLIRNGGKPLRQKNVPNIDWNRADDGREKVALFNLRDDPGEFHNLAGTEVARVRRMSMAMEQWQMEIRSGATLQPGQAE